MSTVQEIEAAIGELQVANRLNPAHLDARKLLAAQYVAQRKFPDAVALLKPVAALPAADEEVHMLLADAQLPLVGKTYSPDLHAY